jgi:phage regulator Rha-like protein
MSSREIAELTGKRHKNAKRGIFSMFEVLEVDQLNFARIYFDALNRQQMECRLNRYYTELLITAYDVKRRAAVVDRWFELEAHPQVPQSFAEALRLAADTQEQLEQRAMSQRP